MTMKVLLAALLATTLGCSWASLGGSATSFGSHASAESAQAASTGLASYTDVQSTLDSGTVVHQYVDGQGTVFAVSWAGPYLPDLKAILGSSFDALTAQAGKRARGSSQVSVQQPDLVIISGGHMGAFQGQAWLPQKLPAGFNTGDIK